ncbi:MAG: TraB/GumN family protein [Aridibacter sp.]
MKKKLIGLLAVAMLFSINATALFGQKAEKTMKNKADKGALLYEITGKGLKKPSYLYGTIHLICSNDMIPIEKFDQYISKTEQMYLELDLDDPNLTKGILAINSAKRDKTIADYLTEDQLAKVSEMFMTYLGAPFEAVKQSHPFFLQQAVITSPKSMGCTPPGSYDKSLMETAVKNKMEVRGFEEIQTQIDAINSITIEKYAEDLYKLAEDPETNFSQFKSMVDIYTTQNSEKLQEFVQSKMVENPAFQDTFLDRRNNSWIPVIEEQIKEKPTFIAVGAAHLNGKTGLITQLKKKGYKLKPIRF